MVALIWVAHESSENEQWDGGDIYSPRDTHTDYSWNAHVYPEKNLMGRPREKHGVSMSQPCVAHGLRISRLWVAHG